MLKIYNSLTKKLEIFNPIDPNNVKIYICGPTVYDHSHIGHARTYVSFDVIRNILEKYFNYNVTFVMNITDIDDKIINKSKETGMSMKDITVKYTNLFLEDMALLNVRKPTVLTKVTEYVDKIKEYVKILENNGYAYESNGSVYFDVMEYKKKFKYPIFREETVNNLGDSPNIQDKKSPLDFALWKKDNLFGSGRPGWHIECSVMANDVLGDYIDIHAGGVDLKFPHHENEIAQCQARYQKKPWVNYFMHTGHLNINGLKMSKSLKNFTTIKSILERCTPIQLRILFLYHQWNKDMNYEEEQIKFAQNVEKKIFNFFMYVNSINNISKIYNKNDIEVLDLISKTSKIVDVSFSNNFDTPSVIKALLELVSFTNSKLDLVSACTLYQVRDFVKRILDILGINKEEKVRDEDSENLAKLINIFRNKIRMALKKGVNKKDLYNICDEVRDNLKDLGYVLEDSKLETLIKKL
ncbi:hypothetical protein NCER_100366 [Vairimorpha ceranae BRL01]|uniref:cysteine--tRNA ligase n=1 Tax=Vairimorpha ceranae (strain BRL01) TaxID=578460 RepID=C4V7D9_VAIC1|nr:hypothetical protein NCER_100366 [Vairimorpha ceranae BRL01]